VAKAAAISHNDLVQKLEGQIRTLEATVASSKENIEQLEKANATVTATVSESTSIEREALLKAQADYKAISEEIDALKGAYSKALGDADTRVAELQEKTSASESLQTQVSALKAEKEETSHKLSELEIEILELKESQETLDDTRDQLQKRITSLEDELAKAAAAVGLTSEAATQKDAAHAKHLQELFAKHEKDLETEASRYTEIVGSLDALKTQYSEALDAHEKTKKDILSNEELHSTKVEELEKAHAVQQAAITAQMERISQELYVCTSTKIFDFFSTHYPGPGVYLQL